MRKSEIKPKFRNTGMPINGEETTLQLVPRFVQLRTEVV
jgi:hypothetical protein